MCLSWILEWQTKKRQSKNTLPFASINTDLSGDDHPHRVRGRDLILLEKLHEFQRFQLQTLNLDQQVGSLHQQLRCRLQLLLQLRFKRHHQFALGTACPLGCCLHLETFV